MGFDEKGYPLRYRVPRHLARIEEFFKAYSDANPSTPIVVENVPPPEEILSKNIGQFLN